MAQTYPVVDCRKNHSKRTARFALALTLAASGLLFEGCNAVQNGSGASSQSPSSPQTSRFALPGATVGSSYREVLSGVPQSSLGFAVAEADLPPGLSLNPLTRLLSGVPSKAGTYNFVLTSLSLESHTTLSYQYTVAVAASTSNNTVNIQVSPAEASVSVGGKAQFAATVKNTSNTAVTWSASAGTISSNGLWTAPSGNSSTPVTITATSVANPSAYSTATASIASQPFSITTKGLPGGMISTSYSASLSTSGGQPPYLWSVASGALPPGLQLNPTTGTLAGSVSTAGTYSFNIQGKDGIAQTAQQSYTLVFSTSSTCGPPTYGCSRTDSAVVQIPAKIPNVGNLTGANTIVTDPDFNNHIVRITDWNTDPSQQSYNRSYVSAASGSADENLWNTNSTMFVVQNLGTASYTYTFDPNTMQAQRMYVSGSSRGGFTFSGDGIWSRVSPSLLYSVSDPAPVINSYDFSDPNTPPTPQPVYDFTSSPNCLPAGFSATWKTKGGVSAGDTTFGMAYSNTGNQGTGVYAVVYRVGSGCTVLNTKTGQVWGDWGAKGTINIRDRWSIHNVKISKDGNWLIIAKTTCFSSSCSNGPYFWQIGTTSVSSCGDGLPSGQRCGGHWTEGYSHWMNNYDAGKFTTRPLSEPTSIFYVTPAPPAGVQDPLDQHASWNNADPADSFPFFLTFWSPSFPFPGPWYDEIAGVAPDGGKVWRFAHSFITAKSQIFSTEYGIGSVSQDGRFFIFSSDWMGTLGGQSGTASCTVGADCRGDVFVLQLN
jgi:hypothetical protein